jgi:hypothetical protein
VTECSFEGCGRPKKTKGLCRGHYTQLYRGRPLRPIRPHVLCGQTFEVCQVADCGREPTAHGYCHTHYSQKYRGRALGRIGPAMMYGERRTYVCVVPNCGRVHRRGGFCQHHSDIKRTYNLDPAEYEQRMAEQGGSCAICHGQCELNSRLSVDHDHASGKIRAFLCNRCNVGLGRFREDPSLLRAAADYLERHQSSEGVAA